VGTKGDYSAFVYRDKGLVKNAALYAAISVMRAFQH
jgi:hypothetical protein